MNLKLNKISIKMVLKQQMAVILGLAFLCTLLMQVDCKEEGHCVWYGECEPTSTGKKNCAYNGTAKPLYDEESLQRLKDYCPYLYTGNGSLTCCSPSQLYTIESNMGLPRQFFSRCPSCYYNFLKLYCYSTCDPHHSDSVRVQSYSTYNKESIVDSIDYIVSKDYAFGMYNSCRNVQMPSANEKALDVFCGRPASQCNPYNWLTYMGDTANGHTPFGITFHIQNDPWTPKDSKQEYQPMNVSVTPCNKKHGNSSACSCQDCEEMCAPIPPIPPPEKPPTIFGIDSWFFIVGCVYLVFVIIFGISVMFHNIVRRNAFGIQPRRNGFSSIEDNENDFYSINTDGVRVETKKKRTQKTANDSLPKIKIQDINCLERIGDKMERKLQDCFQKWGTLCARHPIVVLILGALLAGGCCGGIPLLKITTDPVRLWSSDTSEARTEKHYFDSHFGPFYRPEQIIVRRPGNHSNVVHHLPPPSVLKENYTSIFDKNFMHKLLDLQLSIMNLTAEYDNQTITLDDICFKPLFPDNKKCTVQSVLEYWQNSHENIDKVVWETEYHFTIKADYLDHFSYCTSAPASTWDTTGLNMSCLATGGAPVFPWVTLGGYDGSNFQNSTAFVITFIVNNYLDENKNKPAEAWEKEFIKFMKDFSDPEMAISFSAQRSIEDEIERESNSDILTILISYLLMFAYVSLMLGQYDCARAERLIVDSKIVLGLAGVTIVLLSVGASVGLFSYMQVPATLIIIEVVPFLALAVGVDNIFILVQSYQRSSRKSGETLEEQIGRTLGKVGPSMLLTSLSESVAFFLGALTDMPAVKTFSLYAGMAVFINFLLQISCFVGLMTLDAKRQEKSRYDLCCCITAVDKDKKQTSEGGILFKISKKYYSPFIMKEWVRPIVVLVFTFWFSVSIALIHKIDVGLDQSLSMPDDSYVLDYFKALNKYLHVGSPVYFVVEEGHDYLNTVGQNGICASEGCPQDSLAGQVTTASKQANYTYIAQPVTSWLDDYFSWISSSGHPPCCRVYTKHHDKFCPSTAVPANSTECSACQIQKEVNGRPVKEDFIHYLPMFLEDNPGTLCAKGGHAAYGHAVDLIHNKTAVGATYFMTYHTIMKTSADYIQGLKHAREIAKNITDVIVPPGKNYKVFPYSIFYVFYEQYLTIVHDTIFNLCLCMAAIFLVTFFLMGCDIFSALITVFTIAMIITDLLGYMYLWEISLNAVSLVNLVMAVGISVEFCAHIARAFAVSVQPTRRERAIEALAHIGSSVFSGITLTKLVGIIVLAFSKSQLFQVFYFRMYLSMVIFGATHGLIFLPVLLSYIGPPLNKSKLYNKQNKEKTNTTVTSESETAGLLANEPSTPPPPSYQSVISS